MTLDLELDRFEKDTGESMDRVGLRETQLNLHNPEHVQRARAKGFSFAVGAFDIKDISSTLDVQSGFVYADKACHFAHHKAECLGVKFDLGSLRGAFSGFLEDVHGHMTGVKTADGASHTSELTSMACGGWTPALLPQLDHLCETTSRQCCHVPASPPRKHCGTNSHPATFPKWSFDIRRGRYGGLYGFARDPDGVVKIGYRGTKFTNPQVQPDGTVRSVPVTRWTRHAIHSVPRDYLAHHPKFFVQEQLPTTRL